MMRNDLVVLAALSVFVPACGAETAETNPSTTTATTDETLDVRVTKPAADASYLDFETGEGVIPPGDDKMFCTHVRYDGPDMAFDLLKSMQGKFGHHVVLLGVKEALEPGTTVDCTAKEEMSKYDAFTIGDQELPPDHGVFLPSGKPMVIQMHYLNTGDKPIKVRDYVRLHRIPVEKVKTWASIYVMNSLEFSIPAHGTASTSVDCEVPADVNLLIVGGHMHEYGKTVSLQYGMDSATMQPVFDTQSWVPDYRDNPPMTLFFENPMPLKKGAIMRTSCTWDNPTNEAIAFPTEMCDSFGYVAGSKNPVVCSK